MSNWSPDPQVQELFSRLVSRAFDEAREHEQREQKIADAKRAHDGYYLTCGNIIDRADRGKAAFKTAGRRSVEEVIQTFSEGYGTLPLPLELIAWIREQLTRRFTSYATARAS